jgi:Excreted virulence factor EspC, type VII ESX diderm
LKYSVLRLNSRLHGCQVGNLSATTLTELMTVRGATGTALQTVATELAECLQSAACAYAGAD